MSYADAPFAPERPARFCCHCGTRMDGVGGDLLQCPACRWVPNTPPPVRCFACGSLFALPTCHTCEQLMASYRLPACPTTPVPGAPLDPFDHARLVAVSEGDLHVLERLAVGNPIRFEANLHLAPLSLAGQLGRERVVLFLLHQVQPRAFTEVPTRMEALELASAFGHIDVVRILVGFLRGRYRASLGRPFRPCMCAPFVAALFGRQWVVARWFLGFYIGGMSGRWFRLDAMDKAVEADRLDIVQFLMRADPDILDRTTLIHPNPLRLAARQGSLLILRWALSIHPKYLQWCWGDRRETP